MTERKIIRMPKFHNSSNTLKYFEPRFIEIRRGETIEWLNDDTKKHMILSHKFGQETDLLKIGPLNPKETESKTIDYGISKIDYFCSIHPEEQGTIIILEKNSEEMTNSERFRLLSNAFDIKPSEIMHHLDSTERIAREEIMKDINRPEALVKYFDPLILEALLDPKKYQLQSKSMSIVFWDISGFSDLCNKFAESPTMIVGLLKKYFNEANEVIHRYHGILDKFIGDGIMAYFGYFNDSKFFGATDAINAAVELREKFVKVKDDWIREFSLESNNIPIDIKCGIHTGTLLFGIVETDYRNQITVTGPTVNFASRLEDKAEDDQILISDDTKKIIKDEFVSNEKLVNIQSWGEVKVHVII